jgi:hypothetical protein
VTTRNSVGASKLTAEEARRIGKAISRIPEFLSQRQGFYPRGGGPRWRADRPYHVVLEDMYIREHWDEIYRLCQVNSLPFNATGETIQNDGVWKGPVAALSAQIFYRGADAHVLDIRPVSAVLASYADGIEDTGKAWADHHARWAAQMPRDVTDLWAFVVELDHDSRMALFAHCVSLTVNAVRLQSERRPRAVATADRLAEAVSLDMTAHWTPTVRTYLGRVTKPHILAAVREGVNDEAADRMADMKKQDMAEAAEQALVGTGWLPTLMRTPRAAQELAEHLQADAVTEANPDAYSVAAE